MVSFESLVFYASEASLTAKDIHYRCVRNPTCRFCQVLSGRSRSTCCSSARRFSLSHLNARYLTLSGLHSSVTLPERAHLTTYVKLYCPCHRSTLFLSWHLLCPLQPLIMILPLSFDQSSLNIEGGQVPFIHCY